MTLLDALLLGSIAVGLWLGARRFCSRAYLRINPCYRSLLERHELASPRALLRLPAVIVSGHPDRNVARVTLGSGTDAVSAFLKREHRVRWQQRLANLWAGFGLTSLSHREAVTLRSLRRAGISCPDWVAVGADGQGRAFLLVEEVADCVDLRRFLVDSTLSRQERRRVAADLGETLAQLHAAGFAHPDLYAKHILVNTRDLRLSFLDWQRSQRPHRLSLHERWRDLAALDATLADELAGPRDRLICLRSYIRARLAATRSLRSGARTEGLAGAHALRSEDSASRPNHALNQALTAIRKLRQRLLRRRHIREARQIPTARQELIWLDEDALCVTPEFYHEHNHSLPAGGPLARNEVARATKAMARGGHAFLVRRRMDRVFAWLASWFGGQPLIAPEVRQAGLLFRLQRYGVRTARLLAFGQRQVAPWRIDSFLLTEAPAGARSLAEWLARNAEPLSGVATLKRRALLREIGIALQRLHAAGCYLPDRSSTAEEVSSWFSVQEKYEDHSSEPQVAVTLTRTDGLRLQRQPSRDSAVRDLALLCRRPEALHLSRTDELRVLFGYLGCARLTSDARHFARQIEAHLVNRAGTPSGARRPVTNSCR